MIMTTGFKDAKAISKGAQALAEHLGIDCDITLRKLPNKATESYGFAAQILGTPTICIMSDCPKEIQTKVIAHEMIHVQQMVRGDLVFDYDNMLFHWKGKTYSQDDLKDMDYYERPWEAEAKEFEKELAESFFMS